MRYDDDDDDDDDEDDEIPNTECALLISPRRLIWSNTINFG